MAAPLMPAGGSPDEGAQPVPMTTIGRYQDYASAQRAVDFLSDSGFPVENVSIIGTDLRLVERVLGRLTVMRATGLGALSGAWFGLFVGLLLGIFANSSWLATILIAVLIGAAWGAVFGAINHTMTGGRRDFTSTSSIQASEYAVCAATDHADEARALLARHS